ncbi:Fic family protein [Faecalicatena orotica]|uniref:Fic/DOC family protein n=1 Tax=Faecalicatena orotica TaxID=1544 RepID=A0A2Y9BJG7_9FIRM|nr:Fic family protein [Faecalicatena orotica]PWJ28688.1 Fic/DOC family protein [Faecalicatena orotica]SSA56510.1 Fic/DOC family protein [Faecalicatena orotica]
MDDIKMTELLKERFRIEMEKQDRGGVYALTQRKMAYNSNRIEGSTLTEKQTASIFETGTIRADGSVFRTKDVEEMTGHFTMFNYMLDTCEEILSQRLIKEYHYRLKAGVFEDIANGYPIGEYKNRRNMVSNIMTSTPENVEEDMKVLLEDYNSKEPHSLKDLAEFHARFEKIHPFQDGNGRTGRMILFKECLRSCVMPFIIGNDRKAEYYECLNKAQQNEDYEPLIRYFGQEQERYVEMVKDFIVPVVKK